jgi:hypothetical protein
MSSTATSLPSVFSVEGRLRRLPANDCSKMVQPTSPINSGHGQMTAWQLGRPQSRKSTRPGSRGCGGAAATEVADGWFGKLEGEPSNTESWYGKLEGEGEGELTAAEDETEEGGEARYTNCVSDDGAACCDAATARTGSQNVAAFFTAVPVRAPPPASQPQPGPGARNRLPGRLRSFGTPGGRNLAFESPRSRAASSRRGGSKGEKGEKKKTTKTATGGTGGTGGTGTDYHKMSGSKSTGAL